MAEPADFYSALADAPEDVAKLRSLGANGPAQLLALFLAAPEASAAFLGPDVMRQVGERLCAMVPREARVAANAPPGVLGVPLIPAPHGPLGSRIDLIRRDELLDRLNRLRARRAPPDEIARAEQALDTLLERSGG